MITGESVRDSNDIPQIPGVNMQMNGNHKEMENFSTYLRHSEREYFYESFVKY